MKSGRTISSTLQRDVTVVRRRLRLARLLHLVMPVTAGAAFGWIAVRLLVSFGLFAPDVLGPAAGIAVAAVVAVAAWAAWSTRSDSTSVIREIDRRSRAEGRLIAAWELHGRTGDAFAAAAVEDAWAWVTQRHIDVRTLFVPRMPAQTSRVAALVVLAGASAWLLNGRTVSWPQRGQPRVIATADPDARETLLAAAEAMDLPTLEWTLDELQAFEPERKRNVTRPEPKNNPEARQVVDEASEPTGGKILLDPEARAFLEAMTSPEMRRRVTQEIGTQYTGDKAPPQFERFEVLSKMTRDPNMSGERIIAEDPETNLSDLELDMPSLDQSADIGLKVDPTQFKQDYMQDQNAVSEMVGALKESFSQYLNEFAEQVLEGLEDGLKEGLVSEQRKRDYTSGLRDNPAGLGEATTLSEDGPLAATQGDGSPTAYAEGMTQATGGTAAGGVGAGRGRPGGKGTDVDMDVTDPASGARLDLHGTLDERLAVVDVIQKMSAADDAQVDETALAEVVRKISKEAEVESMHTDEIPADYRDAVTRYFQTLQQ